MHEIKSKSNFISFNAIDLKNEMTVCVCVHCFQAARQVPDADDKDMSVVQGRVKIDVHLRVVSTTLQSKGIEVFMVPSSQHESPQRLQS